MGREKSGRSPDAASSATLGWAMGLENQAGGRGLRMFADSGAELYTSDVELHRVAVKLDVAHKH